MIHWLNHIFKFNRCTGCIYDGDGLVPVEMCGYPKCQHFFKYI